VLEFVKAARREAIGVRIISHKTRRAVADPAVDLHAAGWSWLERNGFFDGDGVTRADVFFEPTRRAKIERIRSERCALFVDDLPEVFCDPAFPDGVERWLYGEPVYPGLRSFSDWSTLLEELRRHVR
jgi:hypothetical protein